MSLLLQGAGSAGVVFPLSQPEMWYDATTLGLADSTAAGTFTNLGSMATGNLVQATAGFKPLYRSATLNGKACLEFDGIDDFMATASNPASGFKAQYFLVAQYKASTFGALINAAQSGTKEIARLDATTMYGYNGGAAASSVVTTPETAHVYTLTTTGATALSSTTKFQVDGGAGNSQLVSAATINGLVMGSRFGGTLFANCRIGELIGYTTALSAPNQLLVEAYLRAKWGTP